MILLSVVPVSRLCFSVMSVILQLGLYLAVTPRTIHLTSRVVFIMTVNNHM